MVDVVLLAFDGAFADTAAVRRDALRHAIAEEVPALADIDLDADAVPVGAALDAAVRAAGAVELVDPTMRELILLRARRQLSARLARGVALAPGVREFLLSLAGRVRVGVVSAAERRDTDAVIALAGLEHLVERIVAVAEATPDDADGAWRLALAQLDRRRSVRADRVLALAHHAADLRAARARGMRVVAVGAVPAERAVEGDAWVPALVGQSLSSVAALTVPRAEGVR